MARIARISLVPFAATLGVLAEWSVLHRGPLEEAASTAEIHLAVGDFVVGVTLVACGVGAWLWRSHSRIGPLLATTGFAWFLGTLAGSSVSSVATFGAVFVTLHRGPLVQSVLSYPSGKLRGRFELLVVGFSYLAAASSDLGQNAEMVLGVAALLLLAACRSYARASGPQRRARIPSVAGALAFSGVLAAGSVANLGGAGDGVDRAILWAYQIVILGIAVGFLAGLLRGSWTEATVTKLVVDLGDVPEEGILRERLATALGDPSLAVGYWIAEERGYFDETGRPLALPEEGSTREVTFARDGEEPVAALVHDPGVLQDRELVESVAAAARIAVSNVRLQTEIRRQVDEIEASRRRIVEAADLERRRLESELRDGAEQRLLQVENALRESAGGGDHAALFDDVLAELGRARAELQEFAQGIHPRVLTEGGLPAALADLARRAPVAVELDAPEERHSPAVEAAAYFVCSEALANIGKYAEASQATVEVERDDDRLVVSVRDDGIGGASLDKGSGLRGLADRVEALGGRLRVDSRPGEGTLLVAELPIIPDARV
jgi:signal transduction histidine kinase